MSTGWDKRQCHCGFLMRPAAIENKRYFSDKIYVGELTNDTMTRGKKRPLQIWREVAIKIKLTSHGQM